MTVSRYNCIQVNDARGGPGRADVRGDRSCPGWAGGRRRLADSEADVRGRGGSGGGRAGRADSERTRMISGPGTRSRDSDAGGAGQTDALGVTVVRAGGVTPADTGEGRVGPGPGGTRSGAAIAAAHCLFVGRER